jgi:hypothetical protein
VLHTWNRPPAINTTIALPPPVSIEAMGFSDPDFLGKSDFSMEIL